MSTTQGQGLEGDTFMASHSRTYVYEVRGEKFWAIFLTQGDT